MTNTHKPNPNDPAHPLHPSGDDAARPDEDLAEDEDLDEEEDEDAESAEAEDDFERRVAPRAPIPASALMPLVFTCAGGTERALRFELQALGAQKLQVLPGAVSALGDETLLARACVTSRVASKALRTLSTFRAETPEALVEHLSTIPFEQWLDSRTTFAVQAHLRDTAWTHTHYAALRVKDAIVDRLRAKGFPRPDVDAKRPMMRFILHWSKAEASLSLDCCGEPLHRRHYRTGVEVTAPLKETLAAALLALAHADIYRPFHDPCCGSGTIAIEQAMRALNRAPSAQRPFACERWRTSPQSLRAAFQRAKQEARDGELDTLPAPIMLSDHDPRACEQARRCIEQAGLSAHLRVLQQDARTCRFSADRPVIFANLPYGDRVGERQGKHLQLYGFYKTLGEHLARQDDARVGLLCPADVQFERITELGSANRRWALFNGPALVTLYRWDTASSQRGAAPQQDRR
jgi:23S rRNA G2445 N2-methylase RlmL